MKNPIFTWDAEEGLATCEIPYKDTFFFATAQCHPDDMDMVGEKTGCTIALYRAEIQMLQYIKNYEIKPALGALKHLAATMHNSKRFNPKSYENIMLQRQIRQKQDELNILYDMIDHKKQMLKEYIHDKDECFKHLRFNRSHPRTEGQN